MEYIREKARDIPVYGDYDVVVVGGGVAGVSAALAARRTGAKTLLIEKQFMLGGLATAGIVTIYLPLCDGEGKQISFGIAEELFKLSMKYGAEEPCPRAWLENTTVKEKAKDRLQLRFNANVFAISMEKILLEEGVEILYGTAVCNTTVSRNKIKSIIIENKSGRSAVTVRSVVDASGDADVVHLCGEQTETFKQGNILAGWYYYHEDNKYNLKMLGWSDIPEKFKTEEQKRLEKNLKRFEGLDGKELSDMMCASHSFTLDDFLKNGGINDNHNLGTIATIPQIRMTRRIVSDYEIDDTEMHKEFPDSVGLFSDWRKRGPVYELPFSCLYGKTVKNLITAGRCISVTEAMWDITRVIPVCAVSGQAAGTAAALSDNFKSLSVKKLQKTLKSDGVILHERELR